MKLLQVNYHRTLPHDDHDQATAMRQAASKIAEIPGLVWKIWIYDDHERSAGGLYLFDTEENARRWGDGPMEESLATHPGIGRIIKRYYDVDLLLSHLSRAAPALTTTDAAKP